MAYAIASLDIHKKVHMVVVASMAEEVDDAAGAAIEFECRRFGAGASERQHLKRWLEQRQVQEVVMESTLEIRVAGPRAVLSETAPGAGKLQPRPQRTQE